MFCATLSLKTSSKNVSNLMLFFAIKSYGGGRKYPQVHDGLAHF